MGNSKLLDWYKQMYRVKMLKVKFNKSLLLSIFRENKLRMYHIQSLFRVIMNLEHEL